MVQNGDALASATVGGVPSAPISGDVARQAIDLALKDTSDAVTRLVGSTPNAAWAALLGGQLRIWSAASGGVLAAYSKTVSGQEWELFAGIIIIVVPAVFSWLSKKWAAIRSHEGNKASAAASAVATVQAGAPVALPVTPA